MVPNIKKLITGFLLVATIITTISFGIKSFLNYQAQKSTSLENISNNTKTTVPENAFLAKQSANSNTTFPSETNAGNSSNNLTERLGTLLANKIIQVNEDAGTLDGPPTGLVAPSKTDLQTLIKENLADAATLQIAPPEFPQNLPPNSLKIIENPTEQDFIAYLSKARNILENTVLSNDFENLQQKPASIEAIYAGISVYGGAVKKLLDLPVPAPLEKFHEKLVVLLSNQKEMVNADLGSPNDPLKSIAILNQIGGKIEYILTRDARNFQLEIDALNLSLLPSSRPLVERVLGIEVARAQTDPGGELGTDWQGGADTGGEIGGGQQVPVKDAGAIAAEKRLIGEQTKSNTRNWFQKTKDIANNILLQELKNQIIRMLEQQIVNWINGGGSPQFVTDWKGFLADAFNNAAGAAIEQLIPQLCYPIQPWLRLTFQVPSVNIPVYNGCTLNQVVNNVTNFYQNIRSGGWLQYGVTFQPTGNPFGILIEGHDTLVQKAIDAANAEEKKVLAGNGFLSTQICPSTKAKPGPQGCPNGESPIVRTPGKVLGDTLSSAIGDMPKSLIVSANDIAGLVATVADAALTRLVTLGVSTASGQTTGSGVTSITYGNGGFAGTAAASCNGLTNEALQECILNAQIADCTNGRTSGPSCDSAKKRLQILTDNKQTIASYKPLDANAANANANPPGDTSYSGPATGGANPLPLPNANVDLSSILTSNFTYLAQNPTDADAPYGNGPAYRAIDRSLGTYSSASGGNPSFWQLALPTPQYLDRLDFQTNSPLTGYYTNTSGYNQPNILFYDVSSKHTYKLNLFENSSTGIIDLTSARVQEKIKDQNGNSPEVPLNKILIASIRFNADVLQLREVALFRHLNPMVGLKLPSSLSIASSTDFDPRPASWVQAVEYPLFNQPKLITDQTRIKVKIEDQLRTPINPVSNSPLRYTLPAGQYYFIYTVSADGFDSVPATTLITVQ